MNNTRLKIVNDIPKEILDYIKSDYENFSISHTLLGRGLSGSVYNVHGYAIKLFNNEWEKDGSILRKLQGYDTFPKLYAYSRRLMVSELIMGQPFRNDLDGEYSDYLEQITEERIDEMKDAFAYASSKGLAPADVGGSNIYVMPNGKLKIVDVGLFGGTKNTFEDVKEGIQYHLERYNKLKTVQKYKKIFRQYA